MPRGKYDHYKIRGKRKPPRSIEHRRHQSESHKGLVGYWLGRERDEETKQKISSANKGRKQVWLNPIAREEKISKTLTGRKRPDISGDKSPMKRPEVRASVSKAMKGKQTKLGKHNKKGRKTYDTKAGMDYFEWRRDVIKRDHHTCQECGETNGRMESHHIRSWVANKEERYNIDNGVTLCQKCHKKRTKYMRGKIID